MIMEWERIEEHTEYVLSRLFEGTRFLNVIGVPIREFGNLEAEMALNMGYFDLVAFKQANQALGISLANYRSGIKEILDRFNARMKTSGYEVALNTSVEEFKDLCREAYSGAYKAGIMRSGSPMAKSPSLPELDLKAINEMVEKEAEFFAKRLSEKAISPDFISTIAERYGASAKAVFWNGLISGSGEGQLFRWQLGSVLTEHCDDCIELASNSPYTKETLPTVPRAGDTRCLWNCHCELVPVGGPGVSMGGAEEFGEEKYVVNVTQPETRQKVVGPVRDDLNDLYMRINKLRVEMVYADNDDLKTALAKERAGVTKELIDKARIYNVRVIPNWSAKDIKTLANTFKSRGLDVVESFRQLRSGDEIYVILGMGVRKGIVDNANPYSATVRINDNLMNFNNIGRFIAFINKSPAIFESVNNKFKITEGGPGSGNFGHAGRPGFVGGSSVSKTSGEEDKLNTQSFFHGTTMDVVKSILKDGLQPVKASERLYSSIFYKGERGDAVYMTSKKEDAQKWAKNAADVVSWKEGKSSVGVAVIEVRIDKGSVKVDDEAGEFSFYRVGGIPAKFIKSVWVADRIPDDTSDFPKFSEWRRVSKSQLAESNQLVLYVPMVICEPERTREKVDQDIRKIPKKEALGLIQSYLREGGEGSGNFGHAGRPGEVGGSLPQGETATGSGEPEVITDATNPNQTHILNWGVPEKLENYLSYTWFQSSKNSDIWNKVAEKEYGVNTVEQLTKIASEDKDKINYIASAMAYEDAVAKNPDVRINGDKLWNEMSDENKQSYIKKVLDEVRKEIQERYFDSREERGKEWPNKDWRKYVNREAEERAVLNVKKEAQGVTTDGEPIYRGIGVSQSQYQDIKKSIAEKGYYDLEITPVASYTTNFGLASDFAVWGQGGKNYPRGGGFIPIVYGVKCDKNNVWIHHKQPLVKNMIKQKKMTFNIGGNNQYEVVYGHPGGKVRLTADNFYDIMHNDYPELRNPKKVSKKEALISIKSYLSEGGEGSGNFGHAGRPGEVGGSLPQGENGEFPVLPSTNEPTPDLTDLIDEARPEEKDALLKYCSLEAWDMNSYLRKGQSWTGPEWFEGQLKKHVAALDSLMSKSVVNQNLTVFRGLKFYDSEQFDSFLDGLKNDILVDDGFVSTSTLKDISQGFMEGEKSALMVIEVPKGSHALWVPGLGAGKDERELILPRSSRFKVLDITKDKNGRINVHVKLVPAKKEALIDLGAILSEGGEGSGNFGHAGRPGEVGGSAPAGTYAEMLNKAPDFKSKQWAKQNQNLYDTDKQFRILSDAAVRFTHGNYGAFRVASMAADMTKEEWEAGLEKLTWQTLWNKEFLNSLASGEATFKSVYPQVPEEYAVFQGQKLNRNVSILEAAKLLNKVIDESERRTEPIYRGVPLFRGSEPYKEVMALKPGDTFSIKGVSSFTTDREIAKGFAYHELGGGKGISKIDRGNYQSVVFKIENAKAVNIAPYSHWKQKEVISRGNYKVKSVVTHDHFSEITLEQI